MNKYYTSNELRESFIKFFKERGHTFVRSSSIVPNNDPTLLFSNAGMNQFKDVFLNIGKRPYTRAVNSQKCLRVSGKHNDLEQVGRDTYHHTFFEMLCNWSFGDYYKTEAISWAWELLTEVWGLPKDKLYATVFRTDDEAFELWKQKTDIEYSHILRFDEKDNFWEMGETGPCGPCSEIHIDRGEEFCDKKEDPNHKCGINGGCSRYIELWNLVFIQFDKDENGILHDLPSKHIDTGAGFERICAILQGKTSNYDTDLFIPIIDELANMCNILYTKGNTDTDIAMRVIADHIRALTFTIADGVFPSNEGRGYVIRRILRRASRFGRKLNQHNPFIYKLVGTLIDIMDEAFPEIKEKADYIIKVIRGEEERFEHTLDRGIEKFNDIIDNLKIENKTEISGVNAFMLHDTYGFPLDLTYLMAEEVGFTVDEEGFEQSMKEQKERSRDAAKFELTTHNDIEWIIYKGAESEFIGYTTTNCETNILSYRCIKDNEYELILEETPFYAESGGQNADKGNIYNNDFKLNVYNVYKDAKSIFIHQAKLEEGVIKDNVVKAVVEADLREDIERNHTATHLLHSALRKVLGTHVYQSGSLVAANHLRFDFTHFEKTSIYELEQIEKLVNEYIRNNCKIITSIEDFEKAKSEGAMALFGEKYDDIVRLVKISDFSIELCGGTHLNYTGEIGCFKITSESSIASGVRRIEACTGAYAWNLLQENERILDTMKEFLKCTPKELSNKVEDLWEKNKKLEKEIILLKQDKLEDEIKTYVDNAEYVDGIRIAHCKFEDIDRKILRKLADKMRDLLGSGIGILAAKIDNKLAFVAIVTKDLIKKKNLHAGKIVNEIAKITGGSGGGKSHLAQAGGKDIDKLDDALNQITKIVKQFLTTEISDKKE